MRVRLVFVFFLTATLSLFAQQPEGTFRTDTDSIVFSGNNIYFSVRGFAGLNVVQVGEGTFEIVDNFIIVETSDFSGTRTQAETLSSENGEKISVQIVDNQGFFVQGVFIESRDARGRSIERRLTNNHGIVHLARKTSDFSGTRTQAETLSSENGEQISVQIVDNQGFFVQGVFIESRDARGRSIERRLTNNHGIVHLARSDNVRSICISSMGHDNISFDYASGSDFRIVIAQHEVIENTTAVFRFNRIDDNFLSLLLLTTDFQEGRNRNRALQQLNNRAQRNNRMERRFRRVVEPVEIEWRF